MRLIQPSLQNEAVKDGQRHTQAYMSDKYYRLDLKPKDFEGSGTSITQINGLTVMQFDTGEDDLARASVFKPQYWWNGLVDWNFRWATSGTSTGAVNATVNIFSYDLDDDTSNRVTLKTGTFNLTPSGTTDYLQSKTVSGAAAINADADLVAVVITRNGISGDTNPNALYLGPSFLEYSPENVQ